MADELLQQIVDKLRDIDERTKRVEHNQEEFKTNFENTDKKLDSITEQFVKNSEDITQTKSDQHYLVAGQQKQDKIIESLAMRSLEQETDIKELQRAK